ncbi:MAG: DEAD/DEAH box helicase family protein, partial [Flavisolibacter sp.]
MEPIDLATATHLIDFSAGKAELMSLGCQQLEGALALHNLLAQKKVAYLADEVGMGKTYIALGVVALMRRFNPSLRVLYLLPKNNVRDKWEKDYRSFIEYNYLFRDLSVKGLDNRPVATYAVCSSITELVQSVSTDSARDYFITTSAFSLALGNTVQDLNNSLNSFLRLLPQHRNRVDPLRLQLKDDIDCAGLGVIKAEIKNQWALALNDILPRFDLVVVDEAHNLKKSRTSSDRNLLLSLLLGADDEPRNRVG